jgi:hypothetical protein
MMLMKGVASARADAIAAEREAEALLEALRLARAHRARAAAAAAGSAALTLAFDDSAEERMGLQAVCQCLGNDDQTSPTRTASYKAISCQLAARQLMHQLACNSFNFKSLACPGDFDIGGWDCGGGGCVGNLTPLGMSVLRAESEPTAVRPAPAVTRKAAAPAAEKMLQGLLRAGAQGYMSRVLGSRQLLLSQSGRGCRSWEDAPPRS